MYVTYVDTMGQIEVIKQFTFLSSSSSFLAMAWILAWYRFRSKSDEEEAPPSLGPNLASAAEAACHAEVIIRSMIITNNI